MDEKRLATIRELVRKTYSDVEVVARYAKVGLWPAEENLVLEYFPDQAQVLDLGCGAGRTTIPLAEMGLEVVGVDLSPVMIQLAQELATVGQVAPQFQVMDVMNLEFASDRFDIALFSYNGIELLPGIAGKKRALHEIFRVLKPGALLIMTTHSPFALNRFAHLRVKTFAKFCLGRLLGLPIKERELGERFSEDDGEEVKYLQILPPFIIKRMLRDCGFEMVYFNTRNRLEKGLRWGWWTVFSDSERFYVARKS